MANYTRTVEFKAKDAQIKSAVDKLAKSLGVIDKLVDGINGKFVKGLRGSVSGISKELKTTVKVANDLSKAFSSAQKQSKKVNVEITKTERGLLRALSAVKSKGGAVSVSTNPNRGIGDVVKNQGIIDAQEALKDFVASAGKANRVFANTEIGLTKQIAGFKGLAASINVSKTAIEGKTAEYKLFMNAVRGQAIAEQNLLRIERERIAARKSLIAGEGLGLTAGPGGTYESIKDILGREDQIGNTLADINLYKGELEEALQFIERGTEEYLQTEAAIERINVDLDKVTKKERERKNELKESGKIIRNMIKDLGKLGGRGIKEFLGVLGGKRGMLPQLAGGAVGLQGIKDMVKFVPFLDKKLKAQVRTYAELGQKATTVLGGIKLASIGLSGALGATTWVVDAIKGFVEFEDAAFETFHRIQGGMSRTQSFFAKFAKELPQLMSSAMLLMPNAFGLGVGGAGLSIKDAFGFMHEGSAAKKIAEGGKWTLERQERARFAQQGPTKLQNLKEELDWQQTLLTQRNTGSKDFMAIQKKILQLEFRIRKEEANRLKTRKKLNGVASEELQLEARKGLAAQRTAAIAEEDRFALMAQRETDSVEFRGRRVSRGGWRRYQQMRKNRKERRERLQEGLMLGAGFPVLFGGGLGAVGGGVAGAVLQSKMGPGKGFGAQILLSAVGQQIDAAFARIINKTKELAAALRKPTENLELLTASIGQANTPFGDTVQTLKKLGLEGVAAEAVLDRFNKTFGTNRQSLTEVGSETIRFQNELQKLATSVALFVAGPLATFLEAVNDTLGNTTSKGIQRESRLKAWNLGLEKFAPGTPKAIANLGAKYNFGGKKIDGQTFDEFRKEISPGFFEQMMNEKGLGGQSGTRNFADEDLQRLIKSRRGKELGELNKQLELEQKSLTIRSEDMAVLKARINLLKIEDQISVKKQNRIDSLSESAKEEIDHELQKLDIQKQINEAQLANAEILANPVAAALVEVQKEMDKLNDAQYQMVELSTAISSSFSESFKGIIKGTMSVQEAFANMFSRIADHFLDMAARMAAAQMQQGILKMFGVITNSSSIWQGNNLDKGMTYWDTDMPIPGLAKGGPVTGGSPYIVGEKGPELFVPSSSGNIVPNHAMGGSTNVVVNVDASGSSVQGDDQSGRQLGEELAAVVQAVIINEKRVGGLLS